MSKHNIPVFADEGLEMDEVLESIAWGLCGMRPRKVSQNPTRRQHRRQPADCARISFGEQTK